MLLFDLVEYYVAASGLPEFVVDHCSRDGCEQEHVEEDEYYEEDVVGLVVLDC